MFLIRAALAAAFVLFGANAWAGACDDPQPIRQSAVINVGAATTTNMIDTTAGLRIYVCSIVATLAGTTPTVTLKYGTKVTNDCDTGATSLSGAMAPTSGSVISMGFGGDLFVTPPGTQLCATTTGTGSSFQGVVTYLKR